MAKHNRVGSLNHPHLERHRMAPAALIVLAVSYSVLIGFPLVRLIEQGEGGGAAVAFLALLILPGLASLLSGVRDLFS